MPVYTNATEVTKYSGEPFIEFAPGANTTSVYAKGLPSGVTLTSHSPTISPWVLLATVSSVPQANPTLVYAYDNIAIFNGSDDTVTISINEDDSNAMALSTKSKELYDNKSRIFGCVEVLTKGSGNVYIYGVK